MTALASTDVTVSISNRDKDFGHGRLGKNITIADLTFGDGSLTYATGGVPLPEIARLGFHKAISFGAIEESADGFVYKFDRANHKLKIFTQGFTTGSTSTAVMEDGAKVEDSFGAEGNPRISNTAKDTTYDTGQLIELPNGSAPAAATVRMMFVGE